VCLCFPAIREASRGRYQGAPFGVPPPLIFEGRKLSAQLARRRENEAAWLFEIRIGKYATVDTYSAVVLAKAGTTEEHDIRW